MTLPSGTIINNCYIFSVYEDSLLLNTISGTGFGRLYQNDEHLYLYGVASGLIQDPDSELNAKVIYGNISSICTTLNDVLIVTKTNTYNRSTNIYSKPVVSGIFVLESTILNTLINSSLSDDGFSIVDIPILLGNSRLGSSDKIVRNAANNQPIGIFVKSDYGIIPLGLVSITDLEAGIL